MARATGVPRYEVYLSDLTTGDAVDETTTGTSWTPTMTLTSGHRYRWWVRTLDAVGFGGGVWSDALDFQVL